MDWPHAIATGIIIALVAYVLEQVGALDGKSRLARALVVGVASGIVVFVMTLFWPAPA